MGALAGIVHLKSAMMRRPLAFQLCPAHSQVPLKGESFHRAEGILMHCRCRSHQSVIVGRLRHWSVAAISIRSYNRERHGRLPERINDR